MSEPLFIPPDGAMQFELHRGKSCSPWRVVPMRVSEAGRVIWVEKGIPNHSSCACGVIYRVIPESLRPENQQLVTGIFAVVCGCMGRIIE